MFCFNLISAGNANKLTPAGLGLSLLLLAALAGMSCSEDPTEVLDSNYNYSGTYVATYATEMLTGDRQYDYGGNSITGLLVIDDTLYSLRIAFQLGSAYFGRTDTGRLIIYDGYVEFATELDTLLQSVPLGYYDATTEQIKISYIRENVLWTEYWKAAVPVTSPDTTTYIPF